MRVFLVVLAYDRAEDGGLGPGTIARLEGAIKASSLLPETETPCFVVGAHLEQDAPAGTKPMKELMAAYLRERGFEALIAEGEAWGTYAEVHACLDTIFHTRYSSPAVLFLSSAGHLTRVECCAAAWQQSREKTAPFALKAVGESLSPLERVREAVALVLLGLGIRSTPRVVRVAKECILSFLEMTGRHKLQEWGIDPDDVR